MYKKYLIASSFLAAMLLGAVTIPNILYDPWWYFNGNILDQVNPYFNERETKINLFLKSPQKYDCLILGSSRVTFLAARYINGYSCFNMAVSASVGQVGELYYFGRYFNKYSSVPKLLIVGVEEFNFQGPPSTNIPEFVRQLKKPPPWYSRYISLEAIEFTHKVAYKNSKSRKSPRVYNQNFEAVFNTNKRLSIDKQVKVIAENIEGCNYLKPIRLGKNFSPDNIKYYKKLIAEFPSARTIGFVPPISVDRLFEIYLLGTLEGYLNNIYETAELFDVFFDFSLPSTITNDGDLTYDGSHFSSATYEKIGKILTKKAGAEVLAVDIKSMGYEQYKQLILMRLESQEFISEYHKRCERIIGI